MVEYETYSQEEMDKRVYEYLVLYMQRNGFAPTHREIEHWTELSSHAICKCLQNLEEQGLLKRTKKKPRAIKLLKYRLVKADDIAN